MAHRLSLDQKKQISVLFMCKPKNVPVTSTSYVIGILASDMSFFECKATLSFKELNANFWRRVIDIFKPFRFTPQTKVVITKDILETEPMRIYLNILHESFCFYMSRVETISVLRRISTAYPHFLKKPAERVKLGDLNRIWECMKESGRCPWITDEVDLLLQRKYSHNLRSQLYMQSKFCRIGAYYVLARIHYTKKNERCLASNAEKSKSMQNS